MSNYFEDLVIGRTVELGSHTFERAEIVAFAALYDPQPFHLSEEGAEGTLFGGLCASGWHTSAVWLRHLVDYRKREADMLTFLGQRPARYGPSPGFEKIRWLKPVYVGDTLRFTTRIREKIPSRSRTGVGLVISENEAHNQDGALVFSVVGKVFVERRSPDA